MNTSKRSSWAQFNDDFKKVLIPEQKAKTFLEIIDLHRIEAVSSKLLAYLLDPRNPHGFNDAALQTLLSLIKTDIPLPPRPIKDANVVQEFHCKLGNKTGRVDIVVELENLVIVIENKIDHKLNNPFDLYKKYCEKHYKTKEIVFLLLCLDHRKITTPEDYKCISHKDYNKALKERLESLQNAFKANIFDYFEAIEKMTVRKKEDLGDVVHFCQEHVDKLDGLESLRKALCDYASDKIIESLDLSGVPHLSEENKSPKKHTQGGWAFLGAYTDINPTQKYKYTFLILQWYVKYVYISVEMFTNKKMNTFLQQNKVNDILKATGVHFVSDLPDDLKLYDENILWYKETKHTSSKELAKQVKHFHDLLSE